jgi:murein L,D-transpeptidase YcbB/YkuD
MSFHPFLCVIQLSLLLFILGSYKIRSSGCTRLAAASDKVYQLLAHGWWFSPASSTTKNGSHDIAEILLKVALNTIYIYY